MAKLLSAADERIRDLVAEKDKDFQINSQLKQRLQQLGNATKKVIQNPWFSSPQKDSEIKNLQILEQKHKQVVYEASYSLLALSQNLKDLVTNNPN